MNMEHYWNNANRTLSKTSPSADLSLTNPILIGVGVNLGPHGEWRLTNETHEPRNNN